MTTAEPGRALLGGGGVNVTISKTLVVTWLKALVEIIEITSETSYH